MIEFDVLPEHLDGTGELLLAHDYGDLSRRTASTLDEGLAHLAGAAYAGVELDVDLKLPGYEDRVVDGAAAPRPRRALADLDDGAGVARDRSASSRPTSASGARSRRCARTRWRTRSSAGPRTR